MHKQNDSFFRELVKMWSNYCIMIRCVTGFFSYLDRCYVEQYKLPSLSDTAATAFFGPVSIIQENVLLPHFLLLVKTAYPLLCLQLLMSFAHLLGLFLLQWWSKNCSSYSGNFYLSPFFFFFNAFLLYMTSKLILDPTRTWWKHDGFEPSGCYAWHMLFRSQIHNAKCFSWWNIWLLLHEKFWMD